MQVVLASNLPACPSDETAYWHNCFGSYTTADGHRTEAEFQNDELNGQGKTLAADGEEYVGEFSDNQIHGWGTYTYSAINTLVNIRMTKGTDTGCSFSRWFKACW